MKYLIFAMGIYLSACNNNPTPTKTGLEGKKLPAFNVLLMDSITTLNTREISTGSPVIFFYFNPNCPYCRAEVEEIKSGIKSLSNIKFYMLSNFPHSDIKNFYNNFELKKYSNIVVAQDIDSYFLNYYKADGVPYFAIFDRGNRLKQVLMGKLSIDLIKDIALN